jgi:hypothetical protein
MILNLNAVMSELFPTKLEIIESGTTFNVSLNMPHISPWTLRDQDWSGYDDDSVLGSSTYLIKVLGSRCVT